MRRVPLLRPADLRPPVHAAVPDDVDLTLLVPDEDERVLPDVAQRVVARARNLRLMPDVHPIPAKDALQLQPVQIRIVEHDDRQPPLRQTLVRLAKDLLRRAHHQCGPKGVSRKREKVSAVCHVRLSSSSASRRMRKWSLGASISSRSPLRVQILRTRTNANSLPISISSPALIGSSSWLWLPAVVMASVPHHVVDPSSPEGALGAFFE